MKTIKNLFSIFVIITSLTFVSCENEPLDSSLLKNANNSSGGNTGGGNTGGGNGNNSGGGNSPFYVKVKIDGVQKQWTGINATAAFLGGPNIFTVSCLNGSNLELSLSINNTLVGPVTTGTYPYEWALVTAIYDDGSSLNLASAYSDFTVSPGNIKITEINTTNETIKGTFTFVGKNDPMTISKNFTEGEFFLEYH